MVRPKSCTICFARTEDGTSRCPKHKNGGSRPRPCMVCGRPTDGANYCLAHAPIMDEAERLMRQPWRLAYKDPLYAKNRVYRFKMARGRCEYCGCDLQPGGWQCDHVVPLRQGGSHDINNLRVACVACHKKKTRTDRRNTA